MFSFKILDSEKKVSHFSPDDYTAVEEKTTHFRANISTLLAYLRISHLTSGVSGLSLLEGCPSLSLLTFPIYFFFRERVNVNLQIVSCKKVIRSNKLRGM